MSHDYGVSEIPQVSDKEIERGLDKFIMIASDGVWDVMNSNEVVGYVFEKLKTDEAIEPHLAEELAKECHKRWRIINYKKNESQKEQIANDSVSEKKASNVSMVKQIQSKTVSNSIDDITVVLLFF